MVAKLLHQAGLNLGDERDLMPAAEENPEGFYEHVGFVDLNDEVLNAAGAGWDCPPPADFAWDDAALDPYRERARELASEFAGVSPWGWKDPRTCVTLPFWQSALGPLRVVFVIRNPLEVVTSLKRRNGFSTALGLTLWQIYAERILTWTEPADRLVTHYDAYFLEPEREIARLIAFLGVDGDQDIAALREAAVPTLRHHRKTVLDLDTFGFPAAAIELYRRLCHEAAWWEGADEPPADAPADAATPSLPAAITRGIGRVDLLRV